MRNIRKLLTVAGFTFALIIGSLTTLSASHNDKESTEPKYVRVHVWAGNPQEKICSHVALQTDKSYVSIRPDDQDQEAQFIDTKDGERIYFKAKTLQVLTFEDDCRLQGNQAPTQTYVLKVNPSTKKLDKEWTKLLEARVNDYVRRQGLRSLDATWSIFSGPDFDGLLAEDEMISSSAAIVLQTLKHGQIPVDTILSKQFETRRIAALVSQLIMSELRGKPDLAKVSKLFQDFGGDNFSFKASDVAELAKVRIKARVLEKLGRKVNHKRLIVQTPEAEGKPAQVIDANQAVTFVSSHFPLLLNDQTAFRDCLRSFGALTEAEDTGMFTIVLNEQTVIDFQKEATKYKGLISWLSGGYCVVQ